MKTLKFNTGDKIVQAKGDAQGCYGTILEIDIEKQRARIQWNAGLKTRMLLKNLELASVPHEIVNDKYIRL